jgi:cell wall-associated NlpC family hydrolase
MNTIDVDVYEEYKVVTEYPDGTTREEIYHSLSEVPTEPDPTPGAVTHTEIVRFADIHVTNLSYTDIAPGYSLNEHQRSFLDFLMGGGSLSMWASLDVNISEAGGQAGMDIDVVIRDLPYGEVGTQIVAAALSKVGTSYGTMDCSALTQYAVGSVGISIPRTAAEQARAMVDGGRAISEATAQPGDLIFWSYESGHGVGRYMNIGHVAIYAGNGMMVESAPSCGGVAYHAVSYQGRGTKVLWARPY